MGEGVAANRRRTEMGGTSALVRIAGAVLLLLIAVGLGCARMGFSSGPKKPPVILSYNNENCLGLPDPVTIWKPKFGRFTTKVKWKVSKDLTKDYYWEIKGKSGSSPLGPVEPIKCGEKKTSSKSTKKNTPVGYWEYSIEVFECPKADDAKSICKNDPKVHIQD